MSTAENAQAPQQQDAELVQTGFAATIEALVAQRDGALQSHAGALSELRITQVLLKRASDAFEQVKADLAAAHGEIARLNAAAPQAADSAQTEQPTNAATAS